MSDSEYSVITSEVIKSFDCNISHLEIFDYGKFALRLSVYLWKFILTGTNLGDGILLPVVVILPAII